MEKQPLSVSGSFFAGWDFFKRHAGFLVLISVIYLGISFLPGLFNKNESPAVQLMLTGVMFVITSVVTIGAIRISFALYAGAPAHVADLFRPVNVVVPYLVASILAFAATVLGFVALIVPGVILSARFSFFDYIIAEYETGPLDALKYSWRLTDGATLPVILFGLAAGVINIAGLLCLGVGLLVTIPLTMMARTYLYRTLQAVKAESADSV